MDYNIKPIKPKTKGKDNKPHRSLYQGHKRSEQARLETIQRKCQRAQKNK